MTAPVGPSQLLHAPRMCVFPASALDFPCSCVCCTLREELLTTLLDLSAPLPDGEEAVMPAVPSSAAAAAAAAGAGGSSGSSCSSSGASSDSSSGMAVIKRLPRRRFDYIVIESSGISEPLPVAETFTFAEEGGAGRELAAHCRLDTCVTVVDAVNFLRDYEGAASLADKGLATHAGDGRHVVDLLIDQVEFANVIVVNKCDLLPLEGGSLLTAAGAASSASAATAAEGAEGGAGAASSAAAATAGSHKARLLAALRALNPAATILEATRGNVPPAAVLNTRLFTLEAAAAAPGWLQELRGAHVPESLEYGISSFVFRASRPFHPARLFDVVHGDGAASASAAAAKAQDAADKAAAAARKLRAKAAKASSDASLKAKAEAAAAAAAAAAEAAAAMPAPPTGSGFGGATGPLATVIRSKGFFWLAVDGGMDEVGIWAQAGRLFSFTPGRPWWATVPRNEWPASAEQQLGAAADAAAAGAGAAAGAASSAAAPAPASSSMSPALWSAKYGDRRQEIVFIGCGMDRAVVEEALRACLLSDDEFAAGPDAWEWYDDPFDFYEYEGSDSDGDGGDGGKGEGGHVHSAACSHGHGHGHGHSHGH